MFIKRTFNEFTVARFTWILLFTISIHFRCVHTKIGYFWHITDLHLDTTYSMNGDVLKSCRHIEHHQSNSGNRKPGRFGDYLCDSPWSLLESAAQAMKSRQGDNVEFVLWTGDGLADSMRRFSESHRIDVLHNITDLLRRTFSSQFVFPVLGHEDGQKNTFRRFGELWRNWLPLEALQTFEKGGYYTIEQTRSRLRIVALNTNFMRHDSRTSQSQINSAAIRQRPNMDSNEHNNYHYHHGYHYRNNNNHNSANGYDNGAMVSALSGADSHESQKQWDWLEDVLAKSQRNGETVYIVGHIPPGSDERQIGTQMNNHMKFSKENNLRYLQLVRKYSSIISGQFFGHLHSDSFRIIYNDHGKPVSWIMIAPSVTPTKSGIGSNNPAMRLYKFDTDTGQVLDYTQYYLDLDAANTAGEPVWQSEYNLTTYYFGSGEVTAMALHNLADRFSNTDNQWFAKYYRANAVRYSTQTCEGVCALNHYCAITRVDYHEFRHCLESAASALASGSVRPRGAIPIVSHIVLVFLIYAIIKRQQRILLFEWLHFLFIDHIVNIVLAKFAIMVAVKLGNKLYFKWYKRANAVTKMFLSSVLSLPSSSSSSSAAETAAVLSSSLQPTPASTTQSIWSLKKFFNHTIPPHSTSTIEWLTMVPIVNGISTHLNTVSTVNYNITNSMYYKRLKMPTKHINHITNNDQLHQIHDNNDDNSFIPSNSCQNNLFLFAQLASNCQNIECKT